MVVKIVPMAHQREFATRAGTLARLINTSPYGTGKTGATILRLRQLVPPLRALLVVPHTQIPSWHAALMEWGRREWLIATLGGPDVTTRKERARAFRAPHNIALLNPEGLRVFGSALANQYDVLGVDELHQYKNPYAVASRGLALLSDQARYVLTMTGSPLTEDLTNLYSVMRIVNPQLVDAEYEPWLRRWFVWEAREDPRTGKRQYPRWHPKEGAWEALVHTLHSISYHCPRERLPVAWPKEINAPSIRVRLSAAERRAYDQLEQECRLVLGKSISLSVENIRPKLNKLLQICSGWVYNEKKRAVAVGSSSKMRALEGHLEEIRHGGRILLWSVWPPEIDWIGTVLERMGMKYALCHGGVKAKLREERRVEFNKGGLDIIVANPAIWGPGVDIYADFATTFSRTWSGEEHGQKRGRPVRANSKQPRVVFTEMFAENTWDETCLWACQSKRDLLRMVMDMRTIPLGRVEDGREPTRLVGYGPIEDGPASEEDLLPATRGADADPMDP